MRTRRRLGALLSAALLVGALPSGAAAAAPVAVDDPGPPCDNATSGGSFPIPEDWKGGSPAGFEGYFVFLDGLGCGLLENDTDADGDPLEFATIGEAMNGEVLQVDATSLAYDPDPDFSTPEGDWVSDTITYTATDGTDVSNEATLRIWVAPINDPPTFASGGDVTVAEDSGAYSDVWATTVRPGPDNESDQEVTFVVTDVDDDGLGLFAVDPTIAADGTLTFEPAPDAVGLAEVTVHLVDDGGLESYSGVSDEMVDPPDDTSDPVTFSIVVTGVDDPPVAVDDAATLAEDDPAQAIDVLANDTDADGGSPVVTGVGEATKGTAAVGADGQDVVYTPDADATGSDSFTYTVTGGSSATVDVTITPVPDDPVADDETLTIAEDGAAIAVPVLTGDTDPDGDALTIAAKTNGAKGTVSITGGGTGLTYRPNANLSGADTFTYTVSDGTGRTDTGTVSVTIAAVNDKPNAVNDTATVPAGAPATHIPVRANDQDVDGDALTIVSATNGAKGTVAITNAGTRVTYQPAAGAAGTDTFTYTISDGHGGTDPATVLVTILADTDPPAVGGLTVSLQPQVLTSGGTPPVTVDLAWSGSDGGRPRRGWYEPGEPPTFQLQLSVDGAAYGTVPLDSPVATAARVPLSLEEEHRLRLRALDAAGNASPYQSFPPLTPSLVQQTAAGISYTGGWSTSTNASMSGGSGRHTSSGTARATFTFTGRAVGWITTWTATSGRVEVWVDGVKAATLDPNVQTNQFRQVAFTSTWTTTDEHVVEIRPLGDGRVDVDGFVVLR